MRRRQLFEFTDLPSCPAVIRRLVVDYLATVLRLFRLDQAMAPLLARTLRSGAGDGPTGGRIVDLCSGASGPLPTLLPLLRAEGITAMAVLTDRYPQVPAWRRTQAAAQAAGLRLDYIDAPVDATAVDPLANPLLGGARTLFDCLHHFPPVAVRAIFDDARRQRVPILCCEITTRTVPSLLRCLLLPALLLLITPLIRPLTWWRLLLTYLIPVALICITWDALVSCLRSYTPDELLALAGTDEGYVWEAGQVEQGGLPITYLIGSPV